MTQKRKIPQIMATQHPDNAYAPEWRDKNSPFISTAGEVAECYHSFYDYDCDEYMWDWEGKFVDEAVIDRLYHRYGDYFKKNPLGQKKFLTFRIPNTNNETGTRLARAFMGIITAAQAAKDFGTHYPPLFEVILPMTTSANQLINVVKKFKKLTGYEKQIFDEVCFGKNKLEMIPLIEGSISLLKSKELLKKYSQKYAKVYGDAPNYLRPFIARSDPALDAGFIPASLAGRVAISEYYTFEKETKIKVYPIIGAGSLNFRGGLAPDNLKNFIENYAGVRTVTIQSAFRYDHKKAVVKKAINQLKKALTQKPPKLFNPSEINKILHLCEDFAAYYRATIEAIAADIVSFAPHIPKHRERIPHSGHFGYSRKVGTSKASLPRAIGFTAVFFSLGIPPTLIGTGRGLRDLIKSGDIKLLENYLPCLKQELKNELKFVNEENLNFLAKKNPAWKTIQEDLEHIKNYLGITSLIKSTDIIYRNTTSDVFHFWKSKKHEDLKVAIKKAARLRKSIG